MSEEHVNQIRGFKATISNPNTSEEAKQHARNQLKELEPNAPNYQAREDENKNPGNIAGGLKAAINNPNVTDEGKEQAQQKLDNLK